MIQLIAQDHISDHIVEQTVEVMKVQECVQVHTEKQSVGMPVSQIQVDVIQLIPQERISDRVVDQTIDVPALEIRESNVKVVKTTLE